MRFLFNLIFFQPLYNGLVWLTDVLPGGTVGWAVVILTLVVRFILFPLQHRMLHTQRKIKELEPTIKELKEKHADDRQAHAEALMALYRQHGVNPFSGFVLLLIQIPLLLALYWVFRSGFNFKPELLYSFVTLPETLNPTFLGFIDLTKRSLSLGVAAGISQFIQLSLALPPTAASAEPAPAKLATSLQKQMRFTLPIMITLFSFGLPAAVALYWVISNLFSVVHELLVRRKAKKLIEA